MHAPSTLQGEAEARGAGGLLTARHAGPDRASERTQAQGPSSAPGHTEQTPGAWRALPSPSPLLASSAPRPAVAGEGVGVLASSCPTDSRCPWSPELCHDLAGGLEGATPLSGPSFCLCGWRSRLCDHTPCSSPASCVPGHLPGVAWPGAARALSTRPSRRPSEVHAVAVPFTGGETEAQKARVTRPRSQSRRWGSQARGLRPPGPCCRM